MKILGLNSAGYNTASCLLVDGEIVFAVEEERLVREKRTRKFPARGIAAALSHAGLSLGDLDGITCSWNPAINLERFDIAQSGRSRYLPELFYNVASNLMALKPGAHAGPSSQLIELADGTRLPIHFINHHNAHAGTFFFSPFEQAAIMTIDAFGEKQCIQFARGSGNRIETLWSQEFPHSLGSFYSTITEFLGFQPQSDEWKLMGASAYGDPKRFYDRLSKLIIWRDGPEFELDLNYFNHFQFHRPGMFTKRLPELLGVKANPKNKDLDADYYDIAAAAQAVFEDVYLRLLSKLHAMTGLDDVVVAGGVALNSVANGMIHERTPFKDVYIPAVPDDSGGAPGSAYYFYNHMMGNKRGRAMTQNYLGPGYSNDEIRATLDRFKVAHTVSDNPSKTAAELIAQGQIIGWFQGRMEFGDRALGNRSILADPRSALIKDRINETVKYREGFRPFAPSIHSERIGEFFTRAQPTPFMEKVFSIKEDKRSLIPGVTHADGTGRLQTVNKATNPLYWSLIQEFEKHSGVPVVLNTSFNVKDEPLVCAPQDALRTFFTSGLDTLVMGNAVVKKR